MGKQKPSSKTFKELQADLEKTAVAVLAPHHTPRTTPSRAPWAKVKEETAVERKAQKGRTEVRKNLHR